MWIDISRSGAIENIGVIGERRGKGEGAGVKPAVQNIPAEAINPVHGAPDDRANDHESRKFLTGTAGLADSATDAGGKQITRAQESLKITIRNNPLAASALRPAFASSSR